jgi:UDP-N-acetylglucosamine transferase subunit ALG13
MIFVTVGTSVPFDRLVDTVNDWATNCPDEQLFAQVGLAKKLPDHIEAVKFVSPSQANQLFLQASLIVSHAGMGSVLTALRYRKPILIMPRRAALGETRNDHQIATAKWLGSRPGVSVAWNEQELLSLLQDRHQLAPGSGISEYAQPDLLERLNNFIMTV